MGFLTDKKSRYQFFRYHTTNDSFRFGQKTKEIYFDTTSAYYYLTFPCYFYTSGAFTLVDPNLLKAVPRLAGPQPSNRINPF